MATVYLSLGSNLGNREANIEAALERLQSPVVRLIAVSSLYETEPIRETATPPPMYLNVCARVETSLPPVQLLDHLHEVESTGGRVRSTKWASRTIDIDILLYDSMTLRSERLIVPHPHMFDRAFVLIPLREIAPNLVFPDGTSLDERLGEPDVAEQLNQGHVRLWEGGKLPGSH